jgi:hypothetical protein
MPKKKLKKNLQQKKREGKKGKGSAIIVVPFSVIGRGSIIKMHIHGRQLS